MIESSDIMNIFSGGSLTCGDRLKLAGQAIDGGANGQAIYIEYVNVLSQKRSVRISWDSAQSNKRNKEIESELRREYSECIDACKYLFMRLRDVVDVCVENDASAFDLL